MMFPWLNRVDLIRYIGSESIPPTFTVDKLSATTGEVVRGPLTDLIGTAAVKQYRDLLLEEGVNIRQRYEEEEPALPLTVVGFDPLPATHPYEVAELIVRFIAYSVWSIYVSKSNVISTDSGMVTKLNPDSERISDRQRTDISSYYRALAELEGIKLGNINRPGCRPNGGSFGQPSVSVSRPRTRPRLGK